MKNKIRRGAAVLFAPYRRMEVKKILQQLQIKSVLAS